MARLVTRLAMKLMALTFVRTSDSIGARWGEFDLGGWLGGIFSPERMKMKTLHIVLKSVIGHPMFYRALQLVSGHGVAVVPR